MINSVNADIQFTSEVEQNNLIYFLDLEIIIMQRDNLALTSSQANAYIYGYNPFNSYNLISNLIKWIFTIHLIIRKAWLEQLNTADLICDKE